MSCPEDIVSQYRANVTLLVSDGCWLSDLEIVYQTWTYVTRGEHIALAGAFLLCLRCNFPVSQQRKCSGFTTNVPCWWHYLWRRKRCSLLEERRHWRQASCHSQFALPVSCCLGDEFSFSCSGCLIIFQGLPSTITPLAVRTSRNEREELNIDFVSCALFLPSSSECLHWGTALPFVFSFCMIQTSPS